MIKVLIADDEKWVCKLLSGIIDWEKNGCEIVKIVYNGNDALQSIRELQPDLVFTDIRMPGLDGIGLIKTALEENCSSLFVIISGYSEFEYAHAAINHGVLGYLLKPIEPEMLTDLLNRIRPVLTKSKDTSTQKTEFIESRRDFRKHYFYTKFFTPQSSEPIEITKKALGYSENAYMTVCCFAADARAKKECACQLALEAIEKQIVDISHNDLNAEIVTKNNVLACIFSYEKEDYPIAKTAEGILEHFLSSDIAQDYHITAAMGTVFCDINDAYHSFQCALDTLRSRMIWGTDKVLISREQSIIDTECFFKTIKPLLTKYIMEKDKSVSDNMINQILPYIRSRQFRESPKNVYLFINKFTNSVFELLIGLTSFEPEPDDKNSIQELQEKLSWKQEHIYSMSDLHSFLLEFFSDLTALLTTDYSGVSATEIVKKYIDDNYAKDITLEELSEHVCLSPKYISDIFKKDFGINFKDYVTFIRTEHAKTFLMEPRYKITDIAEMVGYNNVKYFTKIFKKVVGITPTSFRKLHI